VWPSLTLGRIAGVPVSLKCEQMQLTGSFKIRGAVNFMASLSAAERQSGVVAASAGNHAQGVALAGRNLGVDVTVVMPQTAPLAKVAGARGYGARVVLAGRSLEEARDEAERIVDLEGRIYVPPFDDDRVIAGQGTIGLELLRQAPEAEEFLVPAGGGGLISGIALAIKASRPKIRIIGVQTEAMDGVRQSFFAHARVETPHRDTIADGVAVGGPSDRTLEIIERCVDDVVCVSDEAIARAIVLLIEKSKMVVEGAGALAAAALQSGAYRPSGPTVAVLSGGNIDINLLGTIVRHGLVEAGRYRYLQLKVVDTPGHLAAVSTVVASAGANIIEVEHKREAAGIAVGSALLELLLEVSGEEQFQDIVRGLRDAPDVRLVEDLWSDPGIGGARRS
jgi:threonine dehydratase